MSSRRDPYNSDGFLNAEGAADNNERQHCRDEPKISGGRLKSITDYIPRCRRGYLTKKQIENYMTALLRIVRRGSKICEELDIQCVVEILHRGAELFWSEPMLIELPFPDDGLVVVGDLHGYMIDLLLTMFECGSPTQRHYIFLGDYVDRGSHQIETFLFVLLMKLRWPDRVYMLRGNHETFELNANYQFFAACKRAFGNEDMYHVFGRLFDMMPVAAIFGDYFLCLHGGVSQWMTSRDNIRNLHRPTFMSQMKMLQCCLLADILWADPDLKQKSAFMPSERNTSYTFNAEGLECVLKALNVHTLLRGHQPFLRGYYENVPRKCYTVHTAPCSRDPLFAGAAFLCRREGSSFTVTARSHQVQPDWILVEKCMQAEKMLIKAFASEYTFASTEKDNCDYCAIRIPRTLTRMPRILSHLEIAEWVQTYAKQLVLDDDKYKSLAGKIGLVAKRYVLYFPVYYDILHLNGGTFRVWFSDEEKKLINTYYDDDEFNANIRYSIASSNTNLDISPRDIDVNATPYHSSASFPTILSEEPLILHMESAPSADMPVRECVEKMTISDSNRKRSFFEKIRRLFTCICPNSNYSTDVLDDDDGNGEEDHGPVDNTSDFSLFDTTVDSLT
uniref:Serine/threonine-protein phosphatase n=1 Tax=Ascaris lumbricoides TaxID=6252 RepID=A0A0M3HZH8_ASCLU